MFQSAVIVLSLFAPTQALVVGPSLRAPAPVVTRGALSNVRCNEPPPPPPSGRLGATVDQDGKSNVWVSVWPFDTPWIARPHSHPAPCAHDLRPAPITQAVEPTVKVEKSDKGIMAFVPVAAVAGIALLAIPLLPTLFAANPDQA